MSVPFPLHGPALPTLLRTSTGASPPQAAVGWTILLDPDGRTHGPTTLAPHAGDTFALCVEGSLYRRAVGVAAVLFLALPAGPAIIPGEVFPQGLDGWPLGIEFRVPGRWTRWLAGVPIPAQVRITLADSASTVSLSLCVLPQVAVDAPASIQRGEAATIGVVLSDAAGDPYPLDGTSLVWTGGPLLLTQAAEQLAVDVATGTVTVSLTTTQTRMLTAGPLLWALTDAVQNRQITTGQLQVV